MRSTPAWASEPQVLIAYDEPELRALATRIAWELTSDGYRADMEMQVPQANCSPLAPVYPDSGPAAERIWIRVDHTQASPPAWCAVITHSGHDSGMQQTRLDSASGDLKGFALAVAEAVNGLSSRAVSPQSTPAMAAPVSASNSVTQDAPTHETDRAAVGASATLLLDASHPQPLLALQAIGKLPLNDVLALQLDSLWTVTPLQLEEEAVQIEARLLWTRLSLAVEALREPVRLELLGGAGPAFTWATARVRPPEVARADVGTSAILTVGGAFTFRAASALQLGVLLRASTLLPAVRLQLPGGPSEPFGRLLGETGLGLFARW